MYSTSTISTLGTVAMLTLGCKPTESSAEWMITSSTLRIHFLPSLLILFYFIFIKAHLACSSLLPTRLIVIAEKKTVYEKFPTPLINRLEKHFVLTSSVLTEWQLEVLHHFQNWIHQFSSVTGTSGWEIYIFKKAVITAKTMSITAIAEFSDMLVISV